MNEREELEALRRMAELEAKAGMSEPAVDSATPSYGSRVWESYKSSVKPAAAMLMSPFIGEQGRQALRESGALPSNKPQTFAQSVNQGPVGAGAGALGSIFAPIAPLFEDVAGYAAEKTGATPQQMENVQAVMNIATPAGMRGLGKGLGKATVADVGNVVKTGFNKLPTIGESGVGARQLAVKPEGFNPVKASEVMAKTYRTNQNTASAMYKTVEKIAKGKPVNTSGLSAQVSGLIDDIRADPFHEAKSALPKLEKLQSKLAPVDVANPSYPATSSAKFIQKPSSFDLADAVDLKRTMNQAFKGERWTQNAKGTVYGELGGNVDRILQEAAKKYPKFGLAKSRADKYWLTNVENVFQGDDIIKKFFRPEDMRALEALNTGRAANLPAETLARARAMVSNITNETQLNAVRSLLPPDMAQQLSKEVLKNQGGAGRLKAAGNLARGAIDLRPHGIARTVTNLADVVAGIEKTPMQKALIEAAKKPAPRLYTPAEIKKMTPAQARAAIREMKGK